MMMVSGLPARAQGLVHVSYHQFWLADDEPIPRPPFVVRNGLILAQRGTAVILTGIHTGHVAVSVEVRDSPPQEVDLQGWDEVAEVALEAVSGRVRVRAMMVDSPDLPVFTQAGPGHYRVRVHARGRDTAIDLVAHEPVEDFLIVVWPGAPSPDVLLGPPAARGGPAPKLPAALIETQLVGKPWPGARIDQGLPLRQSLGVIDGELWLQGRAMRTMRRLVIVSLLAMTSALVSGTYAPVHGMLNASSSQGPDQAAARRQALAAARAQMAAAGLPQAPPQPAPHSQTQPPSCSQLLEKLREAAAASGQRYVQCAEPRPASKAALNAASRDAALNGASSVSPQASPFPGGPQAPPPVPAPATSPPAR